MFNLSEYRRRPTCLADYLPWAGLVAAGVVLNKDGSFQRTARFRGPDLESATSHELVATTARLNNALKRLGSGWALFVEAERRPATLYESSQFPDALSWLVDRERCEEFASGAHFESGYTLTLLYLPPPESRARASQWMIESAVTSNVDWREHLSAFVTQTDRFLSLLEGVMPEIAWLDDECTLAYLHSTISTKRHPDSPAGHPFSPGRVTRRLRPDLWSRTDGGRSPPSGAHGPGFPHGHMARAFG